jgi:hypothetical protein
MAPAVTVMAVPPHGGPVSLANQEQLLHGFVPAPQALSEEADGSLARFPSP